MMLRLWVLLFYAGSASEALADLIEWDPKMFIFDQEGTFSSSAQVFFYLWLGTLLILAVVASYFYLKYQSQKELQQDQRRKVSKKTESLLSDLGIREAEHAFLEKIAGDDSSETLYAIVESAEMFEASLEEYKKQHKDKRTDAQIQQLRHKLGFEFSNRRVPFLCTQMLQSSLRMECRLALSKKVISFMSSIVDVTEQYLLIRTPRLKGKPVDFRKFKSLQCKVRREDKEFEFELPILRQLTSQVNALVLGHTTDIRQIYTREYERFPVEIPTHFFLLAERQIMQLKNIDLPQEREKLPQFKGTILDISSKGLNVVCMSHNPSLAVGDVFIFHLKGFNTQEQLNARIVGVVREELGYDVHLRFFRMSERLQWKLDRFLKKVQQVSHRPSDVESELQLMDD